MKVFLLSAVACIFVVLFTAMAGWKVALGIAGVIGTYALVLRIRQGKDGVRRRYLDDWPFDAGETVAWRDDRADCGIIPAIGPARGRRPMRLHLASVLVTNRRIIVASVTLFTRRRAVVYVLCPGAAPDAESRRIDGGLFKRGYTTYVIQPGVMDVHRDGRLAYVALKPAVSVGASLGVAEIRIYSDRLDTFRLPGNRPGEVPP